MLCDAILVKLYAPLLDAGQCVFERNTFSSVHASSMFVVFVVRGIAPAKLNSSCLVVTVSILWFALAAGNRL